MISSSLIWLSIKKLFFVLCRQSQEWDLRFPLVSILLRCQALVRPSLSALSLLGSPNGQQLWLRCFQCLSMLTSVDLSAGSFNVLPAALFSFVGSFLCVWLQPRVYWFIYKQVIKIDKIGVLMWKAFLLLLSLTVDFSWWRCVSWEFYNHLYGYSVFPSCC